MKVRGGLSEHGQKNDAWWTMSWGAVRQAPAKKRQRAFLALGALCSLDCSLTWFHASCDKHLHPIYKSCLFLLEAKHSYRPQSAQCALNLDMVLISCFSRHNLQYVPGTVFKLLCPEKFWERVALWTCSNVLTAIYLHAFLSSKIFP